MGTNDGNGDRQGMGDTERAVQDAFAHFVRHAVDAARDEHDWSITQVAERSGVGRSTIFRWLSGDWLDHPKLPKVRAFCAALGLPLGAALRALTPLTSKTPPPEVPAAAAMEVLLIAVRDRFNDPHTTSAEKEHILTILRRLGRRTTSRAG
ncbi:helix-turn-helix transcriptional regulator [Micromonospora sp. WMMD1155]|uniref:helix-turn-helix domain-containing protein n=1 Tax=Micromonospora sp. WMMD1155 TaxID=3016094 RepID=UPI00249C371D|nr:helix-turn-helix transcriptional regulator [Micromonospora sp. WMMD1155]WFE48837.1 helix-turn-helix transcriptional regulator [Micromonospora sp. WMMD1155]